MNEEKYARENLEAELTNLKEISKEISSQLTELQGTQWNWKLTDLYTH